MALEPCSRTAQINYQKVLVDIGSQSKGEGLRFYLQKDPKAKSLLDEYQEKSKPSIYGATTSTLGSLMVLSGLLNSGETSVTNNSITYAGVFLIAISYLTTRTLQYSNEKILENAVNSYNKRNSPKIIFSPYSNGRDIGIGGAIKAQF